MTLGGPCRPLPIRPRLLTGAPPRASLRPALTTVPCNSTCRLPSQGNATLTVALTGGVAAATPRIEYVLTSTALDSDDVLLNGVPLAVAADGSLATPIVGKAVPTGSDNALTLPGWSLGFFALPQAAAFACRNF